ncbi:MAPEG family protein [Candidatus Binatia bacterium]|nr:MAPEG family protein [Candidatus Binatia bacterium]
MHSAILTPAAVLVIWSLIMLLWLAATRFPAMAKAGVPLRGVVGLRGNALEGVLPDKVNWKAHNYGHLMEQPTIFYPTVIILAMTGADGGLNLTLAWVYVVLRIAHSIVQATWNLVPVRFSLFLVSSLALLALAINALRATL